MELETYYILFPICMAVTICLCIVSITLFFVFDIRKIIGIKTGWTMKQSIRKLQTFYQKEEKKTQKRMAVDSVLVEPEKRVQKETEKKTELIKRTLKSSQTEKLKEEMMGTEEGNFQILETKMIIFSNEIIGGTNHEKDL